MWSKAERRRRIQEQRAHRDKYPVKYWYGTSWGNEVYAYTEDEWGLGGHSATGSGNMANSVIGQSLVAIFMTAPAIAAPLSVLFGIVAVIVSFPDLADMGMGLIWIVGSLICTLLFTGGWLLSVRILRKEWRARKLRKPKGLPKPMYAVTDDRARRWFEQNPGTLEITRENFPYSTYPFPGEPGYVAPKRTDSGLRP